jgi:hypothetical protein
MSELINRWFSRVARVPGMAACGLRYADSSVHSKSWEGHFSETVLNELWSRLLPMTEIAARETPDKLQWTFEGAVIVGAARVNGPTFFVILAKKREVADAAGTEKLLSEFRALRG